MTLKIRINPKLKLGNDELLSFIENVHDRFQDEGETLFKQRNCVKKYQFAIDGKVTDVIVKRFKKTNLIQKISYSFFKSSKCQRAFENALELQMRNVDTPNPIAYVEYWNHNLFEIGYFISTATYAIPIAQKVSNPEFFDPIVASAFARFAADLHLKGILHHDLNSTNVLYCEQDGTFDFSLIDNNRMKFYSIGQSIPLGDCYENMTRFTGDLGIYSYVMKSYVEYRKLSFEEEELNKAVLAKVKHDHNWTRRKRITRFFKFKKKKHKL